jgi:hypothetical protein
MEVYVDRPILDNVLHVIAKWVLLVQCVKQKKTLRVQVTYSRSKFFLRDINLCFLFKQIYVIFNLVFKVAPVFLLTVLNLYVNVLHLRQDVFVNKCWDQIHVFHRPVSMVALVLVAIILFNAHVLRIKLDIVAKSARQHLQAHVVFPLASMVVPVMHLETNLIVIVLLKQVDVIVKTNYH